MLSTINSGSNNVSVLCKTNIFIYYCSVFWGGYYDSDNTRLEELQVDSVHLITGTTARSNIAKLYEECPIMHVREHNDV